LQKGHDVNKELLNGRNALHYAADYGHTDVLQYLISKGGQVDVSSIIVDWYMCTDVLIDLVQQKKKSHGYDFDQSNWFIF